MRMHNISMKTKVERKKLLEVLRKNLEQHSHIVKEAREGYISKAKRELQVRLEQLRKGKAVSLSFTLSPPMDYSEVYKNVISMMEWNTNDFVELQADEFRQLVKDEWDWKETFLRGTMAFSKMSSDLYNESYGGNSDEDCSIGEAPQQT